MGEAERIQKHSSHLDFRVGKKCPQAVYNQPHVFNLNRQQLILNTPRRWQRVKLGILVLPWCSQFDSSQNTWKLSQKRIIDSG
jgi:hypothetical protein